MTLAEIQLHHFELDKGFFFFFFPTFSLFTHFLFCLFMKDFVDSWNLMQLGRGLGGGLRLSYHFTIIKIHCTFALTLMFFHSLHTRTKPRVFLFVCLFSLIRLFFFFSFKFCFGNFLFYLSFFFLNISYSFTNLAGKNFVPCNISMLFRIIVVQARITIIVSICLLQVRLYSSYVSF